MANTVGVNIKKLTIAEEIKAGDYVLMETQQGTMILDFKNFLIGLENITFNATLTAYAAQVAALSAAFDVIDNLAIITFATAVSGLSADFYNFMADQLAVNQQVELLGDEVDDIDSRLTTIQSYSGIWNSVWTTVHTFSATWNPPP